MRVTRQASQRIPRHERTEYSFRWGTDRHLYADRYQAIRLRGVQPAHDRRRQPDLARRLPGQTGTVQLLPGYYGNLERYPFHNPAHGGLSWSGQGRGCNTLTGWFVVDSVAYNSGILSAIDLRFEQHCEGGTAALHGAKSSSSRPYATRPR